MATRRFAVVAGVAVILVAGFAPAADTVVGTFTVHGKATAFKHVVASLQSDPENSEKSWLVVLVSDAPVAEADRAPARLAELAAAGKLKAVRVLWLEGADSLFAVPYHQDLPQSGRRGSVTPSIDLERYDESRFEGTVKSKMMGQDWFFQAKVKAQLVKGGVAELEPAAAEKEVPAASGAPFDPKSAKMLLAAGAKVDAGAKNGITPLLTAAQTCTGTEIVELLIKAGANVNTKAPGGATPMMFAKIFNKTAMEAVLRKAGAKD